MILDTEKLQKFSTFARENKRSLPWVDGQITKGLVKEIRIDGVKFVIVD